MNFMQIKNSDAKCEIYIYGDIVDDSWNWGWEDDPNIYPLNIKSMLDGFEGKDIDVHINSGGGHVFAGAAICNMLKQYKGYTTAYIDGVAASAAATIAFGCDKIIIPQNAYMMIHKPSGGGYGNADELRKCADSLDVLQRGIESLYFSRTQYGVSEQQVTEMVNSETWFTGSEAVLYFKDVELAESVQVLNCSGEYCSKWEKTPSNLKATKLTKRNFNNIEKMKQELELALELA